MQIGEVVCDVKGQVVVSIVRTNLAKQAHGEWPEGSFGWLAGDSGDVIFGGMGFLEPMLLPSLFVLLAFPTVLFKTAVLSSFLQSCPSLAFHSVAPSSWTPQPT